MLVSVVDVFCITNTIKDDSLNNESVPQADEALVLVKPLKSQKFNFHMAVKVTTCCLTVALM